MAARVQIQIEAQDAASGVLRAIVSQFGALGGALSDAADLFSKTSELGAIYTKGLTDMSVSSEDVAKAQESAQAAAARFAETLTLLAIDIMKDAINNVIDYAAEVENLARASGTTAESASRLIQVLDDFRITTDDVTTATRKMTQNGLVPNIETIAQLSDQYLSLNTAQEKNQFLIDNFGRSGAQWAKVLEQGSDAIMKLNSEVSENLILNQKQIESADNLRLKQEELNDSARGLSITFGAYMSPALEAMIGLLDDATNGLADFFEQQANNRTIAIETSRILQEQGHFTGLLNTATAEHVAAAREQAIANIESAESMKEVNTVMSEAVINYDDLIDSIVDYQDEIDRYKERGSELKETESELLEQQALLSAELERAIGSYGANSKAAADVQAQLDGVNGKMDENKKKLAENEEAHRRWAAQTVFAFAQARAAADGSISQMEGDLLIQAGQALGLFDENTAKTMQSVNQAFDTLDTSNAQDVIATLKEQLDALVAGSYVISIGVDAPELPTVPVPPGGSPKPGNPHLPPEPDLGGQAFGSTTNYFYGNVAYISSGGIGEILEYR